MELCLLQRRMTGLVVVGGGGAGRGHAGHLATELGASLFLWG